MKYAVVYNPKARNSSKLPPERICEIISGGGATPVIYETRAKGDGITLAAEAAAEGAARIYAAGGDGTLNEVISGSMGVKNIENMQSPVICPIPLGTVNVFAKEMGFSDDPEKALIDSLDARESFIDVGECRGRYFVLMASVGFDGFVVSRLEEMVAKKSKIKKWGGPLAYVLIGIMALLNYKFPKLKITAYSVFGKKEFTGDFVLMSNSRFYGGKYVLNRDVDISDGFLNLMIFDSSSVFDYLKLFYDVIIRKLPASGPKIMTVPVKKCEIDYYGAPSGPTFSQLDGEVFSGPPLSVKVHEKAVRILKKI